MLDDRLKRISDKYQPKKLTFAEVQFLDTPGLMADERKDNPRRLAVIREANGLVVVLEGVQQLFRFQMRLIRAVHFRTQGKYKKTTQQRQIFLNSHRLKKDSEFPRSQARWKV